MPGLGTQDYPAAPPATEKKDWIKLSATAFMVLMVVALAGSVINTLIKWLNIGH